MTYTSRGLLETSRSPKGNLGSGPDDTYKTTFVYDTDNLGLITSQTHPDVHGASGANPVTVSTYDDRGNLESVTDPTGIVTSWEYDLLNRRIEQRLPDPDGSGVLGDLVTTFEWTVMGDLHSVTDPNGNTTTNLYDLKQNLIETRNADETFRTSEFDGARNLTAATDEPGPHHAVPARQSEQAGSASLRRRDIGPDTVRRWRTSGGVDRCERPIRQGCPTTAWDVS